ncbi:MAG: NAD-dependent epimerase/dehydratase family protein [Candidatus Altiarchaeales archaeon]|nr:NAD-dependent epimerase/dehydratase family protein [Candidatus Altiarchaeales archaeon]MBD3417311.1 NAD-dependent epimerase/dehydratase family protein [Candidatus Altiarchaeales archaeon]
MGLGNKSVLVAGGAGFIGSHIVDRLAVEGLESLVVVDNLFLGSVDNLMEARSQFPELVFYEEDASDPGTMRDIMERHGVDVVFDLAVIPLPASHTRPRWVFEQNVGVTLTLCELAVGGAYDTLIHFSSSEVYGTCEYEPMDEEHPLKGMTPYAASKIASDQLVFSYDRTFGLDASIVRPFNNFGPRQNDGSYAGVIPLTIKRILNNEPPVIYGSGMQTRDYLYVTDTADSAVDIYNSRKTRGKALNIASGKEISIASVIGLISEYMGCEKPIVREPERPGDVRRHIANIFLAKDLIGFKPSVSFEEGLRRTVDWYVQRAKK